MIVGFGIDLVEIRRMRALLQRHPERAARRLFTDAERARCEDRARPVECYAARFAAKEAFLKALGTGLSGGIGWHDVEVAVDEAGRPRLVVRGAAAERLEALGGTRTHLSFSHEAGTSVAAVVIEAPESRAAEGP